MVNQAIAAADTEASGDLMGSILGSLNNAPVENNQIGAIASSLQSVLQAKGQGNAGALMGVLQAVASTGMIEQLLASEQVSAIAQQIGVDPAMIQSVTPLIAQFLVKGSTAQGGGLLQKVLSGEVDLGQMAGLIGMARTIACEVGGDGITVNTVIPGPVASELFTRGHPLGSAKRQTVIDSILVKRVGTPDDVARAVLFFLDRDAGYVTGQALFVCGGTSVTGTGGA